MKRYKLLKDLPGLEKGTILSQHGSALGLKILVTEAGGAVTNFISNEMFEKFFEEIQEPTDSIPWKPEQDEKIWYLDENGDTNFTYFDEDDPYHCRRIEFGNAYRTLDECEKARERKLAKVRLQRTSTFEPDFKNDKAGWAIYYNHRRQELWCDETLWYDAGEPVRYETEEEAEKSIKENEQDWKIYFGVEEEK